MANTSEDMKERIRQALAQLDNGDDDVWTDDGLPQTKVVQRLANDISIKRSDINEASPGFMRKVGDAMGDPPEVIGRGADGPAAEGVTVVSGEEASGEQMTEAEVRAILDQNVAVAQEALVVARRKISEGHAEERRAHAALGAAQKDRLTKFPPLTAAQNIQEYIASEKAKRAAAAGAPGVYKPNQIDLAMQRHNSRGWRRPTRAMLGGTPTGTQ